MIKVTPIKARVAIIPEARLQQEERLFWVLWPASRLIAGFNAPASNLRLLLTAADTRDKAQPDELDQALTLATTLAWQALTVADAMLARLAAPQLGLGYAR
jgi:hypothetical protein